MKILLLMTIFLSSFSLWASDLSYGSFDSGPQNDQTTESHGQVPSEVLTFEKEEMVERDVASDEDEVSEEKVDPISHGTFE